MKTQNYPIRVQYNAILCLNGELPPAEFFTRQTKPIFAADGAAWQLQKRGIIPHLIVGDMDSFAQKEHQGEFATSEFIWMPDQDTNDFEKLLLVSHERKQTSLLVCGMHGGELEHTLNNWSILTRYAWTHTLHIYDAGRIAVPVLDSFALDTKPNEMISLIPQPVVQLTTKGLQWELKDETLELGIREGARNRAVGSRIEITVHNGVVLVFFDATTL